MQVESLSQICLQDTEKARYEPRRSDTSGSQASFGGCIVSRRAQGEQEMQQEFRQSMRFLEPAQLIPNGCDVGHALVADDHRIAALVQHERQEDVAGPLVCFHAAARLFFEQRYVGA